MTLIRNRPPQRGLPEQQDTKVHDSDVGDAAYVAFLMSLARSTGLDVADTIVEALKQKEVTMAGVNYVMERGLLPRADFLSASERFRSFHGV